MNSFVYDQWLKDAIGREAPVTLLFFFSSLRFLPCLHLLFLTMIPLLNSKFLSHFENCTFRLNFLVSCFHILIRKVSLVKIIKEMKVWKKWMSDTGGWIRYLKHGNWLNHFWKEYSCFEEVTFWAQNCYIFIETKWRRGKQLWIKASEGNSTQNFTGRLSPLQRDKTGINTIKHTSE